MIDDILKQDSAIYIYGAGNYGNILFHYCKDIGVDVAGYIVTETTGCSINNGCRVLSVNEYMESNIEYQIIVAIHYNNSVIQTLNNFGLKQVYCLTAADLLKIGQKLLRKYVKFEGDLDKTPYIFISHEKYVNPFNKDDLYFLEFFTGSIDFLLPNLLNEYKLVNEGPYEYGNVSLEEGNVVIDCGACIGSFSQKALNCGCNVIAFEPCPRNFEYLRLITPNERLKIETVALADYNGVGKLFSHSESLGYDGFYPHEDSLNCFDVPVVTIDDYVKKNNIGKVDFIKSNIEGAERLMLHGAKETLKKFAPKLSIRSNHFPDDKYIIEKIINNINPSYSIEYKWKTMYAYV